MDRQVPRAPLPGRSLSSTGTVSCTASKGVTLSSSLIRAHAPAQLSSAYFSLGLVWRIFAGYCQFLLRVGPSRRYLRETLLGCLDLCHGGIRSALARYFLHIIGLPPRVMGRLPTKFHPMTSWWALFSRLQSFLNVQTSKLACHPGHPYRNGVLLGSHGVFIRAEHVSLPPHAPDMLSVRNEQLTEGDFHPISLTALSATPTRSSALGTTVRLGVRVAFCCGRFPLVKPLPSIPSASGFPVLFGDFSGTTGLSDFPCSFIVGVRLWTSRRAPVLTPPGEYGISRFPCEVLPYVHGVFDRERPRHTSRYRCAG